MELNISDQKRQNIKSPTFFRLLKMIQNIKVLREQFISDRIPKFEESFVQR